MANGNGNGKPFNGEGSKSSRQLAIEQASQATYEKVKELTEAGIGPSLEKTLKYIDKLLDQRKTIFFQHQGKVEDKRTVLDIGARVAGVRYGMEIHNLTGRLKIEHSGEVAHKHEKVRTKKDRTRLKNAIKRFSKK